METRPDSILWNSSLAKSISHEFIPTGITNVTVVVNPSLSLVEVEGKVEELVTVSLREKVITLTQLLTPIGIVLVVPWVISMRRKE